MDVMQARFVYEVQRAGERAAAQFDFPDEGVTRVPEVVPPRTYRWRHAFAGALRHLAERLDVPAPRPA